MSNQYQTKHPLSRFKHTNATQPVLITIRQSNTQTPTYMRAIVPTSVTQAQLMDYVQAKLQQGFSARCTHLIKNKENGKLSEIHP